MALHSIEKFKTGGELPPLVVLVNAIIVQAVDDYRRSLKVNDVVGMYECEKSFRSERFMLMTKLNGEWLINKIREEENYEADKLHDRSEEAVCNLPQQGT